MLWFEYHTSERIQSDVMVRAPYIGTVEIDVVIRVLYIGAD